MPVGPTTGLSERTQRRVEAIESMIRRRSRPGKGSRNEAKRPRRGFSLSDDAGLAVDLRQRNGLDAGQAFDVAREVGRVGREPELGGPRGALEEVGEGLDQVGVDAGLGLVEGEEGRRAGAEQGGEQAEVPSESSRASKGRANSGIWRASRNRA
jgi:hypothetical protein